MTFPNFIHEPVAGPRIERVRYELKFRSLKVERITRLTPAMLQVTLSGEDLSAA